MVGSKSFNTLDLVKSRLFQGGRVYPLWQVFRIGQLTGQFFFQGQEWSTTIDLAEGKVKSLVFQNRATKAVGMEGFGELKRVLTSDDATRFSILVPGRMEQP